MELIELIELRNNEYEVKSLENGNLILITNIGYPTVEEFEFIIVNEQNNDKKFITIFNGNLNNDGNDVAVIIVQSTDEGAHYIVKVDDFNGTLKRI